jgi:formaldehyde-activating enzyme involved in methanogenesis
MLISDLDHLEDVCKASDIFGGLFSAHASSASTGVSGYSYNYPTVTGAINRALQECKSVSKATDCKIHHWQET